MKFFTVQSNVLAGVTALLYIIFLLSERKTQKKIPLVIHVLRYIATIDLIITFLVVALFLGFIVDEGYFSMYTNANFFFHFAVPVLNLISFVWFEDTPKFKLIHTLYGMLHLALYSVFYLIVAVSHFKNGAVDIYYDWYAFAQKGLPLAFVSGIVVMALGYFTAYVLYKIINKLNKQ